MAGFSNAHRLGDELPVCADPGSCSVCSLAPLEGESRADHVARLKARFNGACLLLGRGRRLDLLHPAATVERPEPVRLIVPCEACGQPRVTGLACGVCQQERRTP